MAKRRKEINREQEKERIRNYQRRRYKKNRNETLAKLGGQCVRCGNKDRLEVDHIDPTKKDHTLKEGGNLFLWSEERRVRELVKCQLLCKPCHGRKMRLERTGSEEIEHGKWSTYTKYCRGSGCTPCKGAAAEYISGRYWKKRELELEEWLIKLAEEQDISEII